eukprot:COSAG01_NODE_40709_length_460_cov_1.795014_1_plen_107_part_10
MRENLGPRQMQREHVDDDVTLNRRKPRGRGTQVCRYKIPSRPPTASVYRRKAELDADGGSAVAGDAIWGCGRRGVRWLDLPVVRMPHCWTETGSQMTATGIARECSL